jgi:hypothetical protein
VREVHPVHPAAELDPAFDQAGSFAVEQAELDRIGMAGVHADVSTVAGEVDAEPGGELRCCVLGQHHPRSLAHVAGGWARGAGGMSAWTAATTVEP